MSFPPIALVFFIRNSLDIARNLSKYLKHNRRILSKTRHLFGVTTADVKSYVSMERSD